MYEVMDQGYFECRKLLERSDFGLEADLGR